MATTVCSGWHPAAFKTYAKRFVDTFAEHWPAAVSLVVYTEEPVYMPRGECRSLWGIEGAREFHARHKDIKEHAGQAPTRHWRPKDIARLRNGVPAWRWDALRFYKQIIIPEHASRELPDGDILVWLDADVVTFAAVPERAIENTIGDFDLCYLGRNKGSEIGFWAVRLNKRTRAFLSDLSGMYLNDRAFALREWHSAFVWDHVRKGSPKLNARNLTPGGRDHVFCDRRFPLMPFIDHCKGGRKSLGYSPEHPLRWWERAHA